MDANWSSARRGSKYAPKRKSSHAPKLSLLPFEIDSSEIQLPPTLNAIELPNEGHTTAEDAPASVEQSDFLVERYFRSNEPSSAQVNNWTEETRTSTTSSTKNEQVSGLVSHHVENLSSSSAWGQSSSSSRTSAVAERSTTLEQPPKSSLDVTSENSSQQDSPRTRSHNTEESERRNFSMPRAMHDERGNQQTGQVGKQNAIDIFNQQRQDSLATLVPNGLGSRRPSQISMMSPRNTFRGETSTSIPSLPPYSRRGSTTAKTFELSRGESIGQPRAAKNTTPAMVTAHQTPYDRYKSQTERPPYHEHKALIKPPTTIYEEFKVDIDSWPVLPAQRSASLGRHRSLKSTLQSLDKRGLSSTQIPTKNSRTHTNFPSYPTSRRRKEKRASLGFCGNLQTCKIALILGLLVVIVTAIIIGIVLALKRKHVSKSSITSPGSNVNATESGLTPIWRPAIGNTWQIQQGALTTLPTFRAQVHNIDLFDNNSTVIAALHDLGRRVICSFSAGTLETGRPDANKFAKKVLGTQVQNSPNQTWLDTRDQSVRDVMAARIKLAKDNGCDGVDPDHVDGFSTSGGTGFLLTTDTAANYVQWLANTAHTFDIAVGLHNSPELINKTIANVDWQLNEGCAADGNCDEYQSFIFAGKPVFHIEYATNASAAVLDQACNANGAKHFSTLIKRVQLDTWSLQCPYVVPT